MANIGDVNDTEFQASVLDSETPVLVDFWAEWCVPCHMVSPVVEEIGQEKGQDLKVAKLNIDENPDATRTYGVMSIPSLILFKAGKEVVRVTGARPKDANPQRPRPASRVGPPPLTANRPGCRRVVRPRRLEPMRIFRRGDSGSEIADIQSRLTALGADIEGAELVGTFGSSTEAAVRLFSRNGICRWTASSVPTPGSSSWRLAGASATGRCTTEPRCSEETTCANSSGC